MILCPDTLLADTHTYICAINQCTNEQHTLHMNSTIYRDEGGERGGGSLSHRGHGVLQTGEEEREEIRESRSTLTRE